MKALQREVGETIVPFRELRGAVEKSADYQDAKARQALKNVAKEATLTKGEVEELDFLFDSAQSKFKSGLSLKIETLGIEAAAAEVTAFEQSVNAVREGLKLEGTFDGINALEVAASGVRDRFVEVGGEIVKLTGFARNAAGEIEAVFEAVDLAKAGPVLTFSPFSLTDLQANVDKVVSDLKPPDVFVRIDADVDQADETVRAALDKLREFRNSGAFLDIKLLEDGEPEKLQEALRIATAFRDAIVKARDQATELRTASLRGTEADADALERKLATFEKEIAALERLGLSTVGLREQLAATRKAGEDDITSATEKERQKAEAALADIQRAQADAADRVRATFSGLERTLLSGFAAERVALNEVLARAEHELRQLASDPASGIGPELDALLASGVSN